MSTSISSTTQGRGGWLARPSHHHWLEKEGQRLLSFYRASRHPAGGFAALDERGELPHDAQPDTMITARMVHCYSLAEMRGEPGAAVLVEHGLTALAGPLQDSEYGGWYSGLPKGEADDGKQAYIQVFVALAASSAWQAGHSSARPLLEKVIATIEDHFWSEEEGSLRESFSRDWHQEEAYRGANSNMHGTEAFLQLADVLESPLWRHRALAVADKIIHQHARANRYRIIEHFDRKWQPWREYHRDTPKDQFRPYGATPGHAFEWARLLLHLEAGLKREGETPPDWLLGDARALFQKACELGWDVDGEPGLIYTHDWDDQPVVHERLHWPVAEASAAAAALWRRTGDAEYERWYRKCWDTIDQFMIDREHGSWWQELDRQNRPSDELWSGKPDLYHAYQATLLPRLPLAPTMARAIAEEAP